MSSKRNKFLIAILLIAIIAVGAGVYVRQLLTTPTTSSGLAVPNPDTLIEETGSQPQTGIDPADEWFPRGSLIMENVYESLVSYDGPHVDKFIPWLAQSWDISPDGLVYTFHLRRGILFQDGTPFNATAVKYSIDRAVLINAENSPNFLIAASETMAIKGGPRYVNAETVTNYNATEARAYLAAGGVKVIDPYTVQITLEHPYAPALATMVFTVASIVSPSYVIANCPGSAEMPGVVPGKLCDFMLSHAMGTGPFKLVEFQPKVSTVLERFDGYWGGPQNLGPAMLKRYVIKFVPEVGTRELDLFSGTTDGIEIHGTNAFDIIDKDSWLNSRIIKPLKPGIRVWVAPSIAVNRISINPRFPPLNDTRFRQALAYAFPYDRYITDALNGFGARLYAPIPPGMLGYDASLKDYGYNYNPDKARELFQKVGYKGTITIYVLTGDANSLAAVLLIKDSVTQIYPDVKIEIKEIDSVTWGTLFHHHEIPMRIGTWTMDIPDAAPLLSNWVTPGGSAAVFTQFDTNQTLINLVNEAGATIDPAKRLAIYSEVQKEILRKCPFVMINTPVAIFAERDWVLPANDSTGGTWYTGRALNNAEEGDGDGGVAGGYHAYLVWKDTTTKQVVVDIGSGSPLMLALSNPVAAIDTLRHQQFFAVRTM
jgi:peptide/nickel transport system substrate-binding protein